MNLKIFVGLTILITAISCNRGCYSSHEFVTRMNYVVTNTAKVAQEFYASNAWMKNGQVKGVREPESYKIAYDFLNTNSREAYLESTALDLAALFTTVKQAENKRMDHYCWHTPSRRCKIFSKTNDRVAENVAWASNIRSCDWAIIAWIVDDGQPQRGHRNNIFGKDKQTGLSSDGYYYSQ